MQNDIYSKGKKVMHSASFGKLLHAVVTGGSLLGILMFAISHTSYVGQSSPEVGFADASQSGLAIVPASCPSAPNPTSDSYGLRVVNGTDGASVGLEGPPTPIYVFGVYYTSIPFAYTELYCVTNNTGSDVYIPAKTSAELTSFLTTIPTTSDGTFPGATPLLYWRTQESYH
ncbi:MAG: hypothetical protein JWO50_118 [Candidatus Kaiserbacteria bacterium]|nr:hypothetical protein [Candidatus Kaiserbacteria bacterium]